jgi:RimJ/RimL family protein N-acetyltransferase
MNEISFTPRISDFISRVVSNNEEADQLAVEMGCDFRRSSGNARHALDRGAVAFCVFVDSEIAHIGWVAMNKEAKNAFDPAPYYVDFANGEACTGGTFTVQKHRGKGLMAYAYCKRFEYLRDKGITTSRNAVAVDNVISLKVHAKFGPEIYARARYIRILRWTYWKEVPLPKVAG